MGATQQPGRPGKLTGTRIVDLTTVVMGPLATRILADLGADVIKIEAPNGDFIRDLDPKRSEGMSAMSLGLNRNKRSVSLDLKIPAAREALLDLVATSDVFVTNVRPQALDRLRLTDVELRARRPDLIYCTATGFGRDGPYAGKAAYDDVIQAASGLASLATWFGDAPAFLPSIVADKVTALHVAYAILAALYHRAITGEGDVIEVPMAESMAAFNLVEHLGGHTFEPHHGDFSYQRIRSRHRRPRRSADGWICILPYTDQNWTDFFEIAGRPDLARDERFVSINSRLAHVDALYKILDEIVATRTSAEWLELCDRLSIPAVPVVSLERIGDDPHFAAVDLLVEHDHPTEGRYRTTRDPIRFGAGNTGIARHAPTVGQHTVEVLGELGYGTDRISMVIGGG